MKVEEAEADAIKKKGAAEAEAKRKYELTLDGPDAERLTLLEARLENAKAQVASAENNLDNYFSDGFSEINYQIT